MPITAKVLMLGYGAALLAALCVGQSSGFWPAALTFWIGGAVGALIAAAILTALRRRHRGGSVTGDRPQERQDHAEATQAAEGGDAEPRDCRRS